MATDLVISNHGQVTKMTPELLPPSSTFDTTPKGERLNLDRFNVHRPPLHGEYLAELSSDSRHTIHESMTWTIRLSRP
ncbi:hypothetical protein TNCV_2856331 [Trichonephila clavipes]|nr:hypothetical protein TNCV_2856331 [Trichonephila clavipes]